MVIGLIFEIRLILLRVLIACFHEITLHGFEQVGLLGVLKASQWTVFVWSPENFVITERSVQSCVFRCCSEQMYYSRAPFGFYCKTALNLLKTASVIMSRPWVRVGMAAQQVRTTSAGKSKTQGESTAAAAMLLCVSPPILLGQANYKDDGASHVRSNTKMSAPQVKYMIIVF